MSLMLITVHHPPSGGPPVLGITGIIDAEGVTSLQQKMNELIDAGYCNLVLNLSKVVKIDSATFGALVGAQRKCRDKGGTGLGIVCTGAIRAAFGQLPVSNEFVIGNNIHDVSRTLEPAT